MSVCQDSQPYVYELDTAVQGLTGRSYTYFKEDESKPPTPEILHRAALRGDVKLLERALGAGISVDSSDQEGTTALILACIHNHYDCAKMLLEHGANPSAQRMTGSNSLSYAAYGGFLPIVKLLLQYGVNIEPEEKGGATPFLFACLLNHADVAQELLATNPDFEKRMIEWNIPMCLAAQNGHTSIIRFLISRGCDINTQCRNADLTLPTNGTTPLFLACQFGHATVVKRLVDSGADVNLTRDDGCSPLLKAAEKGFTEIVRFLLSKGAHHGQMRNGETPLHVAAYCGRIMVLKALVEHGVDINLMDGRGRPALSRALLGGHAIAVKYITRIMTERNLL
ncbi:ankyrin repeat domain-containing protein 29 [Nephila pilipes]|uniref:Ankyrin repeat domain-containing protein 29 n=1 Tax=Nephila pilipes TaxID=299642 RepID=A0A8X6TTJ3_NEPPI|nr:ankyrin repeat domain-containing protein 29 [Nephila pilipes]